MAKQRVPRTRAGGTWTEAQYWQFIQSGLRQKWSKWPPKFQVLAEATRTIPAAERKERGIRYKSETQCSVCKEWFRPPKKKKVGRYTKTTHYVEVDHIEPVGSFKRGEGFREYCERLYCEKENLRVVCKSCHKQITKEARDGKDRI